MGSGKRVTDTQIIARAGGELERTTETGAGLGMLAHVDTAVRDARLKGRYYRRQMTIPVGAPTTGSSDPLGEKERRIRETVAYIDTGGRLA